ncbi:MAG: TrkH family potassium uptake protein [Candidatus Nanohalobium sp.]
MRVRVLSRITGQFLKVFSLVLTIPFILGFAFSDPLHVKIGFATASFTSLLMGGLLAYVGTSQDIELSEAMASTVAGWVFAVLLGAIPLFDYMTPVSAVFEATAGLTTTGISMLSDPSKLPKSLLFWRALMQWVGGLGILTFFIAVIRESGGASRRLFSAETHKTDAGSIRPSLTKSIKSLWKVYGLVTLLIIVTYMILGMPVFEAFLHAFSGISTGGFSPYAQSMAVYGPAIQAVTVVFMFVGGVNFVLLHGLLHGRIRKMLHNSEFRLYSLFFLLLSAAMLTGFLPGQALPQAVLNAFFQAAAILSSTGYSMSSMAAFSTLLQFIVVGGMFLGGSVGSTAGGIKVFRVKALIELLKTHLRGFRLPETAINEVKIDGEILENSTLRTISVLFFTWVIAVFTGTLAILAFDRVSLIGALSGTVSAIGNMGPMFMQSEQMINLSISSKTTWIILMIAGRLEMLPLLALLNSKIFKDKLKA